MSGHRNVVGKLLCEIRKKQEEFYKIRWSSEVRGERFNVFALCGVDHYETIHSKILAEFLSPKGSHGQKDAYLKPFAQTLGRAENCDFQDWFSDAAIVSTEVSSRIAGVSVGRFDILIEDAVQDTVCIIENKIFASEQPEQLGRYAEWLKQNSAKRKLLVYLTPDGREGTTAKPDDKYIRLAYLSNGEKRCDIVSWLEQCQQWSAGFPFVRESLAQYRNHIINILKGGLSMNDDVVEEMSKDPEAAQLIYDNYASMCVSKANVLLNDILAKYQYEERKPLDFGHTERGFTIMVDSDWNSPIRLFVGFNGTGLSGFFVGVSKDFRGPRADVLDETTLAVWKTAIRRLPNRRGEKFTSNNCWPMWRFIELPDATCSTTWNGQFFKKIENKENKGLKEAFVGAISQAIEDIKVVIEDVEAGEAKFK